MQAMQPSLFDRDLVLLPQPEASLRLSSVDIVSHTVYHCPAEAGAATAVAKKGTKTNKNKGNKPVELKRMPAVFLDPAWKKLVNRVDLNVHVLSMNTSVLKNALFPDPTEVCLVVLVVDV